MTPLLDNILSQPESLRTVLHTHTQQDTGPLEAAARLLRDCRGRVIITGMGASYFASITAAYTLQKAGVSVLCTESAELLHYGAGQIVKGDVAVLVSRSGGSVEVVSLLPLLKNRGVDVIAVSNDAASELARSATVSLVLNSAADQMVAIQTYTGTALVLQLLAELVSGNKLNTLKSEGECALHRMETTIQECAAARTEWRSWLSECAPVYLLGRGMAFATVQEGALLFHETAKAPAVAMSSGQFRHGPVEVVTGDFRGIIIANGTHTHRLEVGLANDLTAMGTPIMWIGHEPDAALANGVRRMITWPDEQPAWVAPFFEVVPLQFAAYELALLRGITPGNFRYTPQITTSEEGFASVAQVA